jgi:hypothetical protein
VTTPSGVASRIAGYFAPPPVGAPPIAQAADSPQTPGGFSVLDVRRAVQAGAAAAGVDGTITATFDPPGAGQLWLVDRAAIYCTSAADTLAFVYVGQVAPQNVIDGSVAGNLDFADNSAPWLVQGSQSLILVWENATPGATALAIAQYRLMG